MESEKFKNALHVLEKYLQIKPDQDDDTEIVDKLKSLCPPKFHSNHYESKPHVSIGLPVFNGGNLLSQAIESLLDQDFRNFELIIADNCSTDKTEDVCLHYLRMDKRIKYYRHEKNLGARANFLKTFGLSTGPFFMFASHDDLREESFISECLRPFDKDSMIALVYPQSQILDMHSRFQCIGNDQLMADQDNPLDRFKNVIWNISMCNAIYGIFRTSTLKRISAWGKTLFGDNLLLAETALLGKIVQIEKPLFVRRLTRNYNYNSHDDRYNQLISEINPSLFSEGITFPHARLAYAHLEIINHSALSETDKDLLSKEVISCFKVKFGSKMRYEIDRAIGLINEDNFFCLWNQREYSKDNISGRKTFESFHINELLKKLTEDIFFFPERKDIVDAFKKCSYELYKRTFL